MIGRISSSSSSPAPLLCSFVSALAGSPVGPVYCLACLICVCGWVVAPLTGSTVIQQCHGGCDPHHCRGGGRGDNKEAFLRPWTIKRLLWHGPPPLLWPPLQQHWTWRSIRTAEGHAKVCSRSCGTSTSAAVTWEWSGSGAGAHTGHTRRGHTHDVHAVPVPDGDTPHSRCVLLPIRIPLCCCLCAPLPVALDRQDRIVAPMICGVQ